MSKGFWGEMEKGLAEGLGFSFVCLLFKLGKDKLDRITI